MSTQTSPAVEVHNFRPTISIETDADNRVVSISVSLDDIYDESFFVDTASPVHSNAASIAVACEALNEILGGAGVTDDVRLHLLADAVATAAYEKNLG